MILRNTWRRSLRNWIVSGNRCKDAFARTSSRSCNLATQAGASRGTSDWRRPSSFGTGLTPSESIWMICLAIFAGTSTNTAGLCYRLLWSMMTSSRGRGSLRWHESLRGRNRERVTMNLSHGRGRNSSNTGDLIKTRYARKEENPDPGGNDAVAAWRGFRSHHTSFSLRLSIAPPRISGASIRRRRSAGALPWGDRCSGIGPRRGCRSGRRIPSSWTGRRRRRCTGRGSSLPRQT